MSRLRRGRRVGDRTLGALVLLAVAIIVWLVFRGLPFGGGYHVDALFRDANQLRVGSPVREAGVAVGQVSGLSAGPGRTTRVTFSLDGAALPLHTDATAQARPRLFLEGGFYVQLSPGTPPAPVLDSGGTIPVPQTSAPVQFGDLLSTFDTPTRGSLRRGVAATAGALGGGGAQGLRGLAPQLAPLLRDVAIFTRAAQGMRADDVPMLVHSGARVSGALADHDVQLGELVDNLDRTAAALDASDGALGATFEQLDATLREAPPTLSAVDHALPTLATFSRALTPGLRAAPPLVDGLSATLSQIAAILAPSQRERVITALRAALQDLPLSLDRLAGLYAATKPVTDCLSSHILPVIQEKVPDGSLSSGDPVWLDFLHGFVGLSSAAQNFDGNGYALRYLSGSGASAVSTGSLPGIGSLSGTPPGPDPVLGSRPAWLGQGVTPPFRPDADCASQPLPDLSAATGPAGLQAAGPTTAPPRAVVAAARRELRGAPGRGR